VRASGQLAALASQAAWPPSSGYLAVAGRPPRLSAGGWGPCARTPTRSGATANDSSVTTQPSGASSGGSPGSPRGPESGAQELDRAEDVIDGEPVGDDHSHPDRRLAWSASFSGPLPPPAALAEYDQAVPGLAREIVDQWKAETEHRHRMIDGLREIDQESMRAYYGSERRSQWLALVVFLAVVAVASDQPASRPTDDATTPVRSPR
jgi:uncharacterized membrane protein